MSNKIKNSIDNINIPDGAEDRVYANIMKKAEAQRSEPKPNKNIRLYTGLCLAAYCIAVIIAAAAISNNKTDDISINTDTEAVTSEVQTVSEAQTSYEAAENDDDNNLAGEMAGNPFAEEFTFEDIKAAGFDVELPENSEIELCHIWENGQADVRFILDGHTYYYSISKENDDFSGIYDSVSESENIGENAVLDTTPMGYYKAHWSGAEYNYYFSNTDGADKSAVIENAEFMLKQAQ